MSTRLNLAAIFLILSQCLCLNMVHAETQSSRNNRIAIISTVT